MTISNGKKLHRMIAHEKKTGEQLISTSDSLRIRRLIGEALVAWFRWVNRED